MAIKVYKPRTPGRRGMTAVTTEELSKKRPEKSLTSFRRSTGARNNDGRTTVRFRGGGHKRLYRKIDFRRDKSGIPGTIAALEYDPNRSARIALVHYKDGEKRYILAPVGLKVGDVVQAGLGSEVRVGNALPLSSMPLGTTIHNVELKPGKGGQLIRSAGGSAQVMGRDGEYVQVRLRSGEMRRILSTCMATVGQVGNTDHENINVGKAGRTRWLGRRPNVRGVVMNPVDHPAWWRRRKVWTGESPSSLPMGSSDQGLQDQEQQGDGQVYYFPSQVGVRDAEVSK